MFTKKWFEDHRVDILPLLSHSTDLNPIKNVRLIIVRGVYGNGVQYKSVESHKTPIDDRWESIEENILQSLVKSMQRQCTAVLQSNGSRKSY